MPNWIHNIISIEGDEDCAREIINLLFDGEDINFDRVIKEPHFEEVLWTEEAVAAYYLLFGFSAEYSKGEEFISHHNKAFEIFNEIGEQKQRAAVESAFIYLINVKNTGRINQRSWRKENWGFCKSPDSAGFDIEWNRFDFRSDWSPATPFIKKLSTMYPSCTFKHKYYDILASIEPKLLTIKDGNIIETLDLNQRDFSSW